MDLELIARTYPDVCITVRLGDLLEANEALARKVREEAEMEISRRFEEHSDYLIAREEARVRLGRPDASTLWRWEKAGYLTPVRIGQKVFYRQSHIEAIIKRNETQTQ